MHGLQTSRADSNPFFAAARLQKHLQTNIAAIEVRSKKINHWQSREY
jgi:hypothetical protein